MTDRKRSSLTPISELLPNLVPKSLKDQNDGALTLRDTQAGLSPPAAPTAYENIQLNLFQKFLANTDEQRATLSNAIDLWDSVPRYSISRQAMTKARVNGEFLRKHELTFQHRGKTYTRIVYPARITDANGKERDYYPSAGEELVEDALRKIATEQQSGYFDLSTYTSGVVFTLYALREELKKRGHTRSYYEIVESLTILSRSSIEIIPHGEGEAKIVAPFLPSLAAVSRAKLRSDPEARWIVSFHPLVTGSIDKVTYRQFNYHLMMSHSTQLARWLHKQLVLKFTFAEMMRPFEMRYRTIKRDSGLLDEYTRERDSIEKVERAFVELKEHRVILDFKRDDVTGPRGKKLDVIFTVHPHMDFVRETKAANRRQTDSEKAVGIGRGSR